MLGPEGKGDGSDPDEAHSDEGAHPSDRKGHLSCLACRQKKRFCDKNKPCGRCKRMGLECISQVREQTRRRTAQHKPLPPSAPPPPVMYRDWPPHNSSYGPVEHIPTAARQDYPDHRWAAEAALYRHSSQPFPDRPIDSARPFSLRPSHQQPNPFHSAPRAVLPPPPQHLQQPPTHVASDRYGIEALMDLHRAAKMNSSQNTMPRDHMGLEAQLQARRLQQAQFVAGGGGGSLEPSRAPPSRPKTEAPAYSPALAGAPAPGRDEVELALDTCIRGLDDLRMAGGLDARKAGFLWRLLGALYLGENDVAGQRVLQSLASLVPQKAHEGDDNVDGSFKRRRQDALAGGLLSGAPPPRSAFSGDARSPQRLHHANSFDSAVQNASAAASLLAMAHRSAHSGQGDRVDTLLETPGTACLRWSLLVSSETGPAEQVVCNDMMGSVFISAEEIRRESVQLRAIMLTVLARLMCRESIEQFFASFAKCFTRDDAGPIHQHQGGGAAPPPANRQDQADCMVQLRDRRDGSMVRCLATVRWRWAPDRVVLACRFWPLTPLLVHGRETASAYRTPHSLPQPPQHEGPRGGPQSTGSSPSSLGSRSSTSRHAPAPHPPGTQHFATQPPAATHGPSLAEAGHRSLGRRPRAPASPLSTSTSSPLYSSALPPAPAPFSLSRYTAVPPDELRGVTDPNGPQRRSASPPQGPLNGPGNGAGNGYGGMGPSMGHMGVGMPRVMVVGI